MSSNRWPDGKYCRSHLIGVPHDAPKFFNAGCATCEKKRATGLVEGNEGPLPKDWRHRRGPHVDAAKRRKTIAAFRMWDMGIGKGAR